MNKRFPLLLSGQVKPGSAAIEEVLRQMGKTRPSDELNCGTCGYDTCREKRRAVLAGKADITMCLPYLKERAESFSDHIIQNTPTPSWSLTTPWSSSRSTTRPAVCWGPGRRS